MVVQKPKAPLSLFIRPVPSRTSLIRVLRPFSYRLAILKAAHRLVLSSLATNELSTICYSFPPSTWLVLQITPISMESDVIRKRSRHDIRCGNNLPLLVLVLVIFPLWPVTPPPPSHLTRLPNSPTIVRRWNIILLNPNSWDPATTSPIFISSISQVHTNHPDYLLALRSSPLSLSSPTRNSSTSSWQQL